MKSAELSKRKKADIIAQAVIDYQDGIKRLVAERNEFQEFQDGNEDLLARIFDNILDETPTTEALSDQKEERLIWVDLLEDIDIYREQFKDQEEWTPLIDKLKEIGYTVSYCLKGETKNKMI